MSTILNNRKKKFDEIDLYVVTCEKLSNGRSNLEVLDAVIKGGGKIIQLRDKQISKRDFFQLAKKFREITLKAGILLIINDYLDVAMAVDADGVHLGQEDFPLKEARKLAPNLILGRSVHSLEQAKIAIAEGADNINIGPIFPTKTKEHAQALGTESIRKIAPEISIPFTVMGGIKPSNIKETVEAGAKKLALVTAVTQAENMVTAVKELRKQIKTC